jgi:O-antigen/teichoic acid export membrane protein
VGPAAPRGAHARAEAAGEVARRYGRTASLLSIAVGVTGFIVYLYFALASHTLDKADYGDITTLWLVVFVTVATLYRPVEQLLSRTIAERHARAGFRGRPLKVAATIQAIIAASVTGICLALREPIQDELLSGSTTLYWILVVSVLAYAGTFFARGFFAGHRRFGLYSAVLLSDAGTRILFPLAVVVGIASGEIAIALGIVAGPLVSLALTPVIVRIVLHGRAARIEAERADAVAREDDDPPPAQDGEARPAAPQAPEFTLAHGGGFAAAVLLIVFSEQLFLSSGTLVIRVTEGAAATGFIFNVLMLARAPIYLFQAVATSLLPHLTRLRYGSARGDDDAFKLSVRVTVAAVIAFAGLVAAVVLIAGPTLMQVAFGDKFSYDRAGLLIVTVGMGFYLAAATLSQAALAQGQARRAALCWIACALAYAAWNVIPVLDEFRRVEVGFAFAAATLCALLYALYRRPHPRPEDALRPDSPQEIEARLAAADEAG